MELLARIRCDHFYRVCLIVVAVLLFLNGLFSKRGWLDWRRIVQQNHNIEQEIVRAAKERDHLEQQIQLFQVSRFHQEMVVRKTLGYIRSDEYFVEFD